MKKILYFLLFALIATTTQARVITSTSTGGNWSSTGTWGSGVVPGSTDTAIIATLSGYSVTVNTTETVLNITINSSATLTISYTLNVNGLLTNNGSVGGSSILYFKASSGTVLSGNGSWSSNTGTIEFEGTNQTIDASVSLSKSTGGITLNTNALGGPITVTNNGSISLSDVNLGHIINSGSTYTSIWKNAASSYLSVAAASFTGAKDSLYASATGNTVVFGSSSTIILMSPKNNTFYNLVIAGTGIQSMPNNYSAYSVTINSGAELNMSGDSLFLTSSWSHTGTVINHQSTATLDTAVIKVSGSIVQKVPPTAFKITSTSTATLWLLSSSWVNGLVPGPIDTAVVATTSGYTVDANNYAYKVIVNSGATLYGDLTISGILINNGTITPSGTFIFTLNNGTVISGGGSWGGGNIGLQFQGTYQVIDASANVVAGQVKLNTTSLGGPVKVRNKGSIKLTDLGWVANQGSTYSSVWINDTNAYLKVLTSSFTNSKDTLYANAPGNTIEYGGNSVYTMKTPKTTYYNLTTSDTNTAKLPAALTVTNNLKISVGTLDVTTSNYGLTIGGNFTDNGTFTQRSGTVTFNGSANQQLNGSNTPTFYNLTENQAAANDSLFLNAGLTVSNTLTTTQGILDCQKNQLTNSATPVVSLSPSSAIICNGSSTMIAASNYSNYVWFPSTGLSSTTSSSVSADPSATTTYTVYGVNSHTYTCGTGIDAITVNITPTITVTPSTGMCEYNTATLTASGASTYSWSPSSGLSTTTGASVTATPTTTTTYTVTGTGTDGCTATNTVPVSYCPGVNCSSAIALSSLPVTITDSITTDTIKWYSFVADSTADQVQIIDLASTQENVHRIGIYASCGGTVLQQANVTGSSQDTLILSDSTLTTGNTYLIAISTGVCNTCTTHTAYHLTVRKYIIPSRNINFNNFYDTTGCGINYAMKSVPIHGRFVANDCIAASTGNTGTINITTIPPGATICRAYLVWETVGFNDAAVAAASLQNFSLTNPSGSNYTAASPHVTVSQTTIPISDAATCWADHSSNAMFTYFTNNTYSCAYVADIKSCINPLLPNGNYTITGLPYETPANYAAGANSPDAEGATLIIIYADPCANYTGNYDLVLGLNFQSGLAGGTAKYSITLPWAATGNGNAFFISGDMEVCGNDNYGINSSTATTGAWALPGDPAYLWNQEISPAPIAFASQSIVNYAISTLGDCYNMVAFGAYWNTTNAAICEPLTVSASPTTICIGQPVTLTASTPGSIPNVIYTWSPGGFTGSSITVYPTSTTTYSVQASVGGNNIPCETGSVTVTVDPGPTLPSSPITMCTGTAVGLNPPCSGFPLGCNGSYSWSDPSLGFTSTSADPIVSPSSTTTYSVTVTDANGCSSNGTVTVNVGTSPPAPTISGPNLQCVSGTYSVTGVSGSSYTWAAVNGTVSPTSGTGPITATWTNTTSGGDIICTVTSSTGCSTTDTLEVGGCADCQGSNPPLEFDNLYLSSFGSTPSSDPPFYTISYSTLTNTYTITGAGSTNFPIDFNGIFTIDANLIIQNMDIYLGSNARINVRSGTAYTLDIEDCYLHACYNMWDGIYVDATTVGNSVTVNNTLIEDAKNAIVSINGAQYTVTSSTFNKNHIGILAEPYGGAHPGSVSGTTFSCTSSSYSFSTYATTLGASVVSLLTPYSSYCSLNGMDILGVNTITVDGSSATNTFQYMDCGIYSNNSGLTVKDCDFTNMWKTSYSNPKGVFTGVYATTGGSVTVGGSFPCTFTDCFIGTGVYSGVVASVTYNTYVRTTNNGKTIGVDMQNNRNITGLAVEYNTVNNLFIGINAFNNIGSTIVMDNNDITGTTANAAANGSANYGIEINEPTRIGTTIYNVGPYNTISTVTSGIYTINLENSSIFYNQPITISGVGVPGYNEGIHLKNPLQDFVNENWVYYAGTNKTTNGINVIQGGGANVITCNKLGQPVSGVNQGPYHGILFSGMQTPGTLVDINDMYMPPASTGTAYGVYFYQYPNTTIGGQKDPAGYATSNEWFPSNLSSGPPWATWVQVGNIPGTTVFYVNPTISGVAQYPKLGMDNVSSAKYNLIGFNPGNTSDNYLCRPPRFGKFKDSIPLVDSVALHIIHDTDKYNFYAYAQSAIWQSKYSLFMYLTQVDSSLAATDAVVKNFLDSTEAANMGKIEKIVNYVVPPLGSVPNISAAQVMNTSIILPDSEEATYKAFYNVWLTMQANGQDYPDSTEKLALQAIAAECPEQYGMAVYNARALLSQVDTTKYINTCERVDTSGVEHRMIRPDNQNNNPVGISAKVYPNPASTLLNVEIQLQPNQTATICIYNSLGAEIKCENLTSTLTTINTSNLSAGIYYYRIMDNNGSLIKADKEIIVR
jgi:hypothetical protein